MKRQPAKHATEWFDRCPRCSGVCDREPGASRCRLCGRVFYVKGAGAQQAEFERVSGLIGRRDAWANVSTRPTWRMALRPME